VVRGQLFDSFAVHTAAAKDAVPSNLLDSICKGMMVTRGVQELVSTIGSAHLKVKKVKDLLQNQLVVALSGVAPADWLKAAVDSTKG
jgi:hypothetical protein